MLAFEVRMTGGRKSNYRVASRSFTLVEMLVVIAIFSVLASLLIPALGNGMNAARTTSCANNMKGIGLGLLGYADENYGMLKPTYVGDPSVNSSWWVFQIHRNVGCPPVYSSGTMLKCPSFTGSNYYAMNLYAGSIDASGSPSADYIGNISRLKYPSTSYYVADGNLNGDNSCWSYRMYPFPEDSWKSGRHMDVERHPSGANSLCPDGHVQTSSLALTLVDSSSLDYRIHWYFK